MNSRFKFKAWDKKNNCWLKVPFVINANGLIFFEYIGGGKVQKDIKIVEFTGLKDENGCEIYEGDILSFYTQRKFGHQFDNVKVILPPVEFGDFTVQNCSLYRFTGFHIKGHSIKDYLDFKSEVIGNIYENPELVK